jgi:hypothetical protein
VTTSWEVFPRLSVTVARRSYTPSASFVVSYEMLHGAEVSVPRLVHVAPPVGVAAKATLTAPLPLTVAFRVTVPKIVEPGLARVTVGAVTSTSNVTTAPANVLPAPSVITGRRS